MRYSHVYQSKLGAITMTSDGSSLTGLRFAPGEKERIGTTAVARSDFSSAGCSRDKTALSVFKDTERWLDIYFSGQAPDFTPPLAPEGTVFAQAVWEIVRTTPYGQTLSYGEVARRLTLSQGRPVPVSAQAVGSALGRNPILLIIPCHRIIAADGSLAGYAGGPDRKAALLEAERAALKGVGCTSPER